MNAFSLPHSDPRKKWELRQFKRDIKRAGNRKRRRFYDRELLRNPDEAHLTDFDYGRYSSEAMNGIDNDHTRD